MRAILQCVLNSDVYLIKHLVSQREWVGGTYNATQCMFWFTLFLPLCITTADLTSGNQLPGACACSSILQQAVFGRGPRPGIATVLRLWMQTLITQ